MPRQALGLLQQNDSYTAHHPRSTGAIVYRTTVHGIAKHYNAELVEPGRRAGKGIAPCLTIALHILLFLLLTLKIMKVENEVLTHVSCREIF